MNEEKSSRLEDKKNSRGRRTMRKMPFLAWVLF
jgi:hypothetical protein